MAAMETPQIVIQEVSNGTTDHYTDDCPANEPVYAVLDKYTAGIELSNTCRRFYNSRLQAASVMRERLNGGQTETSPVKVTENPCLKKAKTGSMGAVATAMAKLRSEVASLMEQDLVLMKQMLTLNEQIEELKWQRKLQGNYTPGGLGNMSSSCFLRASYASTQSSSVHSCPLLEDRLSDVDGELRMKYPSPSNLSLLDEASTCEFFASADELPAQKIIPGTSFAPEKYMIKVDGCPANRSDREGSCSTRSTSDLGSSDESGTDLPRSQPMWTPHQSALDSESSETRPNGQTESHDSTHGGYYTLDEVASFHQDVHTYEALRYGHRSGSFGGDDDLCSTPRAEQASFDSGIQVQLGTMSSAR